MEISGLISGLFVGIVIGLIARILVPSMQPIGCFVTVLIGVVGGAGGAAEPPPAGCASRQRGRVASLERETRQAPQPEAEGGRGLWRPPQPGTSLYQSV